MDENRQLIYNLIAKYMLFIVLAMFISFLLGLSFSKKEIVESVTQRSDTVYSTKTIVRVDTVKILSPMPFRLFFRGDSITVKDSIVLPIEVKQYQTDKYFASVSGVHPNLDSIYVYPKQTIIENDRLINNYEEKIVKGKDKRRWGLGISAGYGISRDGPSPYVGISLNYNIFRF